MPVRVLVVDDSPFFRRRVTEMLKSDKGIEVVGVAGDGAAAVDMVERLRPDVVTMDIEMPVMDGITAVHQIMAKQPTPIMMFSSFTTAGAQATLDALDAGAVDFMPKDLGAMWTDRESAKRQLCTRLRLIGARSRKVAKLAAGGVARRPAQSYEEPSFTLRDFDVLVIGASTGGPAALQTLLPRLPHTFPLPILIVQHMPASFTPPFAARLDAACKIRVVHAQDGEPIKSGTAYLAPGGSQLAVQTSGGRLVVQVAPGHPEQIYRPSLDVTFASAARHYGGRVLALVLTGMGADGREGARALKARGATVWAQDEASCVVYGMPMAVFEAGLADALIPLGVIADRIVQGA